MASGEWIQLILLGALLGLIGQGVRVVVGLKKLYEDTSQKKKQFTDDFNATKLLVSLLIGVVAGAIAAISVASGNTPTNLGKELILTLLAAGYAGTDFIEGFIKKYLPSS